MLNQYMTGGQLIESMPTIQPNLVELPQHTFSLGETARHKPAFIFTTNPVFASPTLYSTPTIVNVIGGTLPNRTVAHGLPPIQASNVPIKGCAK